MRQTHNDTDGIRLPYADFLLSSTIIQPASRLRLDRPPVPTRIQLSEEIPGSLEWSLGDGERLGAPPELCLDSFRKLHDATNERVLEFVKSYGTLGVDAEECTYRWRFDVRARLAEQLHAQESFQKWRDNERVSLIEQLGVEEFNKEISEENSVLSPDYRPYPGASTIDETIAIVKEALSNVPPNIWREEDTEGYREPVEVYKAYAKQVRAILEIAACLLDNESTRLEDWGAAFRWPDPMSFQWRGHVKGNVQNIATPYQLAQQDMLAAIVTALLYEGRVEPCFNWPAGRDLPVLTLAETEDSFNAHGLDALERLMGGDHWDRRWEAKPGSLLHTIALQLVAALSSARGMSKCDICGEMILNNERKLRPDRRRFCGQSCRDLAHRETMRSYQRKKRGMN